MFPSTDPTIRIASSPPKARMICAGASSCCPGAPAPRARRRSLCATLAAPFSRCWTNDRVASASVADPAIVRGCGRRRVSTMRDIASMRRGSIVRRISWVEYFQSTGAARDATEEPLERLVDRSGSSTSICGADGAYGHEADGCNEPSSVLTCGWRLRFMPHAGQNRLSLCCGFVSGLLFSAVGIDSGVGGGRRKWPPSSSHM